MTKKQQKSGQNEPEPERGEVSREWLVRGAMRGNKEALQDLCKTVAQDVLFSTCRILNNRSDAEDAAQEILIRLCMGIRDLHDPKAFDVWLGRITTNETRRVMMKNKKHNSVVSISDYIDAIEEENEDFLPQDCAIRQEDRKLVLEIVDRLPERQREAVTLHYFSCLSVTETAEAMEVRHQVASRYLKLAREKIKEELEQRDFGAWASARGLALLPMGALLSQVLQQESGALALTNSAWIQQAATTCPAAAGGAAKTTAAGAGLVKAAAAVVTAGAIAAGAWAGYTNIHKVEAPTPPPSPPPPIVRTSDYDVIFSGGSESAEHINPERAEAYVGTDHGDMTANSWWITSADESGLVLYSGSGGFADEVFAQMRSDGLDGEFEINFRMQDAADNTYTLTRQFTIINSLN